jgi:hypothetical protein
LPKIKNIDFRVCGEHCSKLVFSWEEEGKSGRQTREFDNYNMKPYPGDPDDEAAIAKHAKAENAARKNYIEACREKIGKPVLPPPKGDAA